MKEQVQQYITNELQVEANINAAFKININSKAATSDMILVELESYEKKMEIMRSKSKIRNTKVYIDNDLTRTERDIQKEIVSIARKENSKGNKTNIGYQRLYINGKLFKWNKNENGLAEHNPKN